MTRLSVYKNPDDPGYLVDRRWCNKMSSIPAAPDFLTV